MVNAITEMNNVNSQHNKKNIKFSQNFPKKDEDTKQSPDSTNKTNKLCENPKQNENITNDKVKENNKSIKIKGFKENDLNIISETEIPKTNHKDVMDEIQETAKPLAKVDDLNKDNKTNLNISKESAKMSPKSVELKIITTTFLPNPIEENLN